MKLSRYSIIGVLMALGLTALATVPTFAVTATIEYVDEDGDTIEFMAPGGTATVDVDDPDVTNATDLSDALTDDWSGGAGTAHFFSLEDSNGLSGTGAGEGVDFGTGTPGGDELVGTPDITSVTFGVEGDWVVSVANPDTGRISVTYIGDDTPGASETVNIDYTVAALATVTVDLESASGQIDLVLTETEAGSGIFQGVFEASNTQDENAPTPRIAAPSGEIIRATYQDVDEDGDSEGTRTSDISVEANVPRGDLVEPENGSRTDADEPLFRVDWTDLESGVDEGSIVFDCLEATGPFTCAQIEAELERDTDEITNGFRATWTLTDLDFSDETQRIVWVSEASDIAGNEASTDAEPADEQVQPFVVIVDQEGPEVENANVEATTGVWFDESADAVEQDPANARNDMIGISFPALFGTGGTHGGFTVPAASESFDADTLDNTDFVVDDLKISGGTVLNDLTGSEIDVHWFEDAPDWIFIEVPEMAPDAQPVIHVVSSFSDSVGNSSDTGDIGGEDEEATDGIAPTITWNIDPMIDDESVTVTIESNEPLAGNPFVRANDGLFRGTSRSATLVATREWQATLAPGGDGVYAVEIDVTDGNNSVTVGTPLTEEDFPTDDSIVFYIDSNLDNAEVSSGEVDDLDNADVENASPFFIEFDFTAEGAEYGLDSEDLSVADMTVGEASINLDEHDEVTITSITLDGEDVSDMLDTQDNNSFTLVLDEIETGEHTLVYEAEDEAGNETGEVEIDFTVIEREPYSVALRPGWNLMSFPGNPENPDLDDVFPADHPATTIFEFMNGVWRFAEREDGGEWDGTLTQIDGRRGYWVNTSSSQPATAQLNLPGVGVTEELPRIPLVRGWNLISVLDLDQADQGTEGSCVDSDDYFAGVSWSVAYTFNERSQTWERKTSDDDTEVCNGEGVWVWATSAGNVIP